MTRTVELYDEVYQLVVKHLRDVGMSDDIDERVATYVNYRLHVHIVDNLRRT